MLVPQLPPESATATALRLDVLADDELHAEVSALPADPEAEQWSRHEQLLAGIHDELQVLRWLYMSAHGDPKKPLNWKPEPLPRPGVASTPSRPLLAPEQASALARHLSLTQGEEATYN